MSSIGTLIVDDQEDIRFLMRLVIERSNDGLYVSGEATGGEEALARMDELNPDAIVLDEMMPGMDGIETAARIRERRPNQVMIMCTAFLDETLRLRARAAGIHFCVSKTQVADLPALLRRALTST